MASKRRREPSINLLPEYQDADLGDERRSERLLKVAAAAAAEPRASLRASAGDDAALEGTYRLLNNEAVEAEDIFGPHQRQTLRRAAEHPSCIAIHDTSELVFQGESAREGLGRLRRIGGAQGMYLHLSLLVAEDTLRTPLGVIRFSTHTRDGLPTEKKSHRRYREDPCHEGRRWLEAVSESQAYFSAAQHCVHVMDREADSYELLATMLERSWQFVVRMSSDRATSTAIENSRAHVRVRGTLAAVGFTRSRDVTLSRRAKSLPPSKVHQPRDPRCAKLLIRACPVALLRPTSADTDLPAQLNLFAVQVCELDPPEGAQPVEWTLLTNLPISGESEIERIVDLYRARWIIEEYFKALKTGCALESRQHDNLHALRNVLAVFLPIAWRMLVLRRLAASESCAPATQALTVAQLEVLLALANKPLPDAPTVTDVMWAIASLAGHHHRRTRPGWQTLGRGFEKLLFAETVWAAARRTDHKEL
jgi:hypothetical protein